MALRDILGQPQVTGALRRAVTQGRLHHALLFHGPDGVGKRACAVALARLLLCARPARAPLGGEGGEPLLDACG